MRLIYTTLPTKEQAIEMARVLVSEQLVACANVVDNATSIYMWDGELNEEREVLLFAKTRKECVHMVIERIKELHSYDCPCVVSFDVSESSGEFLKWVDASVKLPY